MTNQKKQENKFPSKVLSNKFAKVVLATSLLTSIGASIPVNEYIPNLVGTEKADAAILKIKDLQAGSVIRFGGRDWIVLNPITGYLISNTSIGTHAFDPDKTNIFNPGDGNNIGHYLNNDFYNTFTNEEKAVIKTNNWSIGYDSNEYASTVSAKISLISTSEYNIYKNYMNINNQTQYLRTPFGFSNSPNTHVWFMPNNNLSNEYYNATMKHNIFPTMYIDSGMSVVNGDVNVNVPSQSSPVLTIDNTSVTNKNLTVTIDFANEAVTKLYSINNGAWTTYTGPITITDNGTIKAKSLNSFGNSSHESSLVINNIDKLAPIISITNIANGDIFSTNITPNIQITDSNSFTQTMKLNGKVYGGSPISSSGNYTLEITAEDIAGNKTSMAIDFKINKAPTILDAIPDNQYLSTNTNHNILTLKGTVKDSDVGQLLNVKYTIDGIPYHTDNGIANLTSNAGNQSFNENIIIDDKISEKEHTIRVWVIDDQGQKSVEVVKTFTVDKTSPEITFTDVVDGKVYAGLVTPIVSVTDANSPSHKMTLNGKSYLGGPITESGKHELIVTAEDIAGNKTTKNIKFEVNQTPDKKGTIDNKIWEKFKEESIDLSSIFQDAEADTLTFNITSSDPTSVSVTQNRNSLILKALEIGTSTITITANDGHSTSNSHTFDVEVTSRPPVLTLTNQNMVLLDDNKTLEIKGTVNDSDLEVVTITSRVNGIDKVASLTTTGAEDNWNLTYDSNILPIGAFLLELKAQDPFGGESIYTGKTVVLKVPGKIAEYEPTLAIYEKDLSKKLNDIDIAEHSLLLDAYIAMKAVENNNSPLVWDEAKQKVQLLVDGEVKKKYLNTLSKIILEQINKNPVNTTVDDLENIGIKDIDPSLEKEYQDGLKEYAKDLGRELTQEDIQKVIDVINTVDEALKSGDPQKVIDAIKEVENLHDGTLKDKLLELLKEEAKNLVIKNPDKVSKELLDAAGFTDVDSTLIPEYQEALKDYVQPLDESSIQSIINLINQVKITKIQLTQTEMTKLDVMLSSLANSKTKDAYTVVSNTLRAIYAYEEDMTSDKFDEMNLLIKSVTTSDKAYFEKISNALESVLLAVKKPSDATVLDAQTKISLLLQGDFKNRLQNRVGSAYLDHVIKNPSDSTYEDLINAGLDGVKKDNFDQIKDAIVDMTNEIGQLTKEQIQAIIDAINSVNKAKANPTELTINEARNTVSKLPNSKVKTELNNILDTLSKSIQPKPKPSTGEKPTVTLPPVTDKSDKKMVAESKDASVVLEIDKKSVAVNEDVKLQIKVQSKNDLKKSKLTLYAKPKNSSQKYSAALASLSFNGLGLTATSVGYETILEIDIMDLLNGKYEGNKSFKFAEEGEFDIKAVFEKNDNTKEIIETNSVAVEVYKNLQIPNTVLPNKHNLSVATLKTKDKINLYSIDSTGNFIKAKEVEKDTLLHVKDTYKSYYKLSDGLYASTGSGTVHIGKGEVRKDKVNVYDKAGNIVRTLPKGQEYKVYSYDNKRYAIGGGEYIEVQDGVTYVFGWMTLKEETLLYKKDGTVERKLKKGEKYRIYSIEEEKIHLGDGLTVKLDLNKFTFLKN